MRGRRDARRRPALSYPGSRAGCGTTPDCGDDRPSRRRSRRCSRPRRTRAGECVWSRSSRPRDQAAGSEPFREPVRDPAVADAIDPHVGAHQQAHDGVHSVGQRRHLHGRILDEPTAPAAKNLRTGRASRDWRDAGRTSSTVPRPAFVSARVRGASAVVVAPFVRERKSRAARSRSPRLPLVVKAQVRCLLANAPCRSANHSSLVACRIPIAKRNAATGGLARTRSVSTAGVLQSWHSRCAATASPSSGADWVAQTSERRARIHGWKATVPIALGRVWEASADDWPCFSRCSCRWARCRRDGALPVGP